MSSNFLQENNSGTQADSTTDGDGNNLTSQITLTVSSILSLIATSALLLYYARNKKRRTYGFRLVIPLFFFDFLWSLNILIPIIVLYIDPEYIIDVPWCRIQGSIKLFTMLASYFCTVTITWSLYSFLILLRPVTIKNPLEHYAKYTLVIPLFLAVIPLALDRYDRLNPLSNVMCFLVLRTSSGTDYLGIAVRIVFYDLPFFVVLLFHVYAVWRIIKHYYKNKGDTVERSVCHLVMYPIVLFLSWIWIIIERFFEVMYYNEQIAWLNKIDLSLATLNGFLNALVYGYISIDPFGFFRKDNNSESLIASNINNNATIIQQQDANNVFSIGSDDNSLVFHVNPANDSDITLSVHNNNKNNLIW